MNTPSRNGKSEGDELPRMISGFPVPQALWKAVNRDPDAVMALLWALDRLVSRKPKPSVCYPGKCDCPFCHPDYAKLMTDNR